MHSSPQKNGSDSSGRYLPGRPLDVLSGTEQLFDFIEKTLVNNTAAAGTVGGNFRIELYGFTPITVVTHGPHTGIYYQTSKLAVDSVLRCEEWFLDGLLRPEADVPTDSQARRIAGLEVEGDFEIIRRFLTLSEARSPLALRLGRGL